MRALERGGAEKVEKPEQASAAMQLKVAEPMQQQPQSNFSVKNRMIKGRRTSMIEDLRIGNMLDFKIKKYAAGLDVIGEMQQAFEQ